MRWFWLYFGCYLIVVAHVGAQTDLTIQGSGRSIPLALPELCLQSGQGDAHREIPAIMAKDLDLSGYFEILNPGAFIETPGRCVGPDGFAYSDWSVIGAEGLVRGILQLSGRTLRLQIYLHDVPKQKAVLGKEYSADVSDARALAHRFANEIMRYYTGEPGVFGSKLAFSTRVGRFKELSVMDMDGSNLKQVTNERGLAVSAAFSPDGNKLAYTSYRNRVPDIFMIDLASSRSTQVSRGTALELGAEFMPDGNSLILSRSSGDESDIILMDLAGNTKRTLTPRNGNIDVSPALSPDGQQLLFCSNRAGGPQIYSMNIDGSGVRRVSFVTSNYCTSPAWSPIGDKIAFVCRADRGFQLFIANKDGSDPFQLTSYGSNEDPVFSPDGRLVAFASNLGKGSTFHIAMIRTDGANLRQITNGRTDDTQPTWGPVPK